MGAPNSIAFRTGIGEIDGQPSVFICGSNKVMPSLLEHGAALLTKDR